MARTGKITMDGYDLWATFGVFAVRGAYNDLVGLPGLKEPSSYSWESEHGDDVDLTSRKVAYRDVTLSFLMKGSSMSDLNAKRTNFLNALKADGWRAFVFTTLSLTLSMYYKDCSDAKLYPGPQPKIELKLKFRLKTI